MGPYRLNGLLAPGQSECIQSADGYRRFRRSLMVFFRATKLGKAMRAVAIDAAAARLVGIRVESVFMSAWALAAGYLVAAMLMAAAAVAEAIFGVDAEGQPLESIAGPLSSE